MLKVVGILLLIVAMIGAANTGLLTSGLATLIILGLVIWLIGGTRIGRFLAGVLLIGRGLGL